MCLWCGVLVLSLWSIEYYTKCKKIVSHKKSLGIFNLAKGARGENISHFLGTNNITCPGVQSAKSKWAHGPKKIFELKTDQYNKKYGKILQNLYQPIKG
jgi:hypothetical protein